MAHNNNKIDLSPKPDFLFSQRGQSGLEQKPMNIEQVKNK